MDQVKLPEQSMMASMQTFDSIFEFALDVNVINMDTIESFGLILQNLKLICVNITKSKVNIATVIPKFNISPQNPK